MKNLSSEDLESFLASTSRKVRSDCGTEIEFKRASMSPCAYDESDPEEVPADVYAMSIPLISTSWHTFFNAKQLRELAGIALEAAEHLEKFPYESE